MTKLLYGVGYNDLAHKSQYSKSDNRPYYTRWASMLGRVYNPKLYYVNPSYINVNVCEEWWTFSNFKAWMMEQAWEDCHLDKDILGDGTLYSPETCYFVTREMNLFLKPYNGRISPEIIRAKTGWRAICPDPVVGEVCLGVFQTKEDALQKWKTYKIGLVENIATGFPDRVKEAMKQKIRDL